MLWGWRPRSLNPKGSQITVSPSPVDHRRGINASPHRRIRVPEGNKSIALGSASVLVSDNNCLQDLPKLLKVLPHGLLLGLPCQPSYKHLGVGCVPKLPYHTRWTHDTNFNSAARNLAQKRNKKNQQLRI
jgi:hypothetical protein